MSNNDMNRRISRIDERVFTVNEDLRYYDNTKDCRISRLDDANDTTVERLLIFERYFKIILGVLLIMFLVLLVVVVLVIVLFTK